VEIGNELYGGGQFRTAFPDGTSYGRTVTIYVQALHADFPGVQVAADGALNNQSSREKQWNDQMLAAATGAGSPDAVIFHDYPGITDQPFTSGDLPPLFAMPYGAITTIGSAAQALHGKPVWLTEYNFRGPYQPHKKNATPNPVQTSYAHELFLAEFALMLPRTPHLALVDNWTAIQDSKVFSAWTNARDPVLTPGGQAIEMVDTAAHGATSTTPITIAGAPMLPGGAPAVTGQAFSGSGHAASVLVNLTANDQTVPLGADIPAGASYQQVSGDPTAQETVAGPMRTGTVTATGLTLPAYSITVLGATWS
jgi:hypothetical protein